MLLDTFHDKNSFKLLHLLQLFILSQLLHLVQLLHLICLTWEFNMDMIYGVVWKCITNPTSWVRFPLRRFVFQFFFSLTTCRNIVFGLLNVQLGIQLGSTCHSNRLGQWGARSRVLKLSIQSLLTQPLATFKLVVCSYLQSFLLLISMQPASSLHHGSVIFPTCTVI